MKNRLVLLCGTVAVTLTAVLSVFGSSAAMAAGTPTATTNPATGVTPTTAALTGSVNLQGGSLSGTTASADTGLVDATGCYFEYGTTTSYGSYVSCTPTPTNASSADQAVTAPVTATAGQTYHYRLVIQVANSSLPVLGLAAGATEYDGADQSFTTPSTTAVPAVTTTSASSVGSASASLNATANAENWAITGCAFTYTPSGGAAATVPCATTPSGATTQNVSATIGSGLAPGTAYSYSLTLTYNNGATVTSSPAGSFRTLSASVSAPSALTATTATLNGTVDPEGQTITACTFYYGSSAANLQTTPCSTAAGQITGTSNISVSANVSGLAQRTAYVDTVVLTTTDDALDVAPAASFVTLAEPKATTTAATAVTTTTATLHATVNAGGEAVRACGFEWGVNPLTTATTGSDLALIEPCASTPAASGNRTTSVTLKGLAPGTTYYFRVLVVTYGGDVIANTVSFKTLSGTTARPTVAIRASTVSTKARTARFTFARTGKTTVTKGFQCALVTVTKGKAGSPRYASCKSIKSYTKLKLATYIFYVRGANANGYGKAASHRFVA